MDLLQTLWSVERRLDKLDTFFDDIVESHHWSDECRLLATEICSHLYTFRGALIETASLYDTEQASIDELHDDGADPDDDADADEGVDADADADKGVDADKGIDADEDAGTGAHRRVNVHNDPRPLAIECRVAAILESINSDPLSVDEITLLILGKKLKVPDREDLAFSRLLSLRTSCIVPSST